MTESEMLIAFSAFVGREIPPESWLPWWEEHADELKALLAPGQFLRLKPRGMSQGQTSAIARCYQEIQSILQSTLYSAGLAVDF